MKSYTRVGWLDMSDVFLVLSDHTVLEKINYAYIY